MSLFDDLNSWYADQSYPPSGNDVAAKVISEEYTDKTRWGMVFVKVYQRGSELVAVEDVEPATESQDWGDYGPPEIYHVEPHDVTVTKYRKI